MLQLNSHHYRAVSMACPKVSDRGLQHPYVEPAGPDHVRLLGTDGFMALALRVGAKHDLTGPCRLDPYKGSGKLTQVEAVISKNTQNLEALGKWLEKLETLMPGETEDSQPVSFDPKKLSKLCSALDVLGCSFTLHTRAAAAGIFDLRGGAINDLEAGIAVLMPLKSSLDISFWLDELPKSIDRFKAN